MIGTRFGAAALLVGAAASACSTTTAGSPVAESAPATTTAATTTSAPSTCDYQATPGTPSAGKDVGLPSGEDSPATLTLVTSHGELTLAMDVAKAPCTTASIAHLARSGFYDNSPCHRMTKAEALSVLQCGDPSGQGTGGPGYTIPDENPTHLLPAGIGDAVKYPRGTVAMANAGPRTGGSQFFLVYADSVLPPTYAVFATLDAASLAVLDKIAATGIKEGGQDGSPGAPVTIVTTRTP